VNYFTPATLRRLAAESGFEVLQGWLDCLPTSDTMYAVLRKSAASGAVSDSGVAVLSHRRAA
jgi:hypothetical protein